VAHVLWFDPAVPGARAVDPLTRPPDPVAAAPGPASVDPDWIAVVEWSTRTDFTSQRGSRAIDDRFGRFVDEVPGDVANSTKDGASDGIGRDEATGTTGEERDEEGEQSKQEGNACFHGL